MWFRLPAAYPLCIYIRTLAHLWFVVEFYNYFTGMITILRQRDACNIWVATLKAKVTAWPCSKIVSVPKLYLKSGFTTTFDKLLLCVQYLFEHYPVPTGSCYFSSSSPLGHKASTFCLHFNLSVLYLMIFPSLWVHLCRSRCPWDAFASPCVFRLRAITGPFLGDTNVTCFDCVYRTVQGPNSFTSTRPTPSTMWQHSTRSWPISNSNWNRYLYFLYTYWWSLYNTS